MSKPIAPLTIAYMASGVRTALQKHSALPPGYDAEIELFDACLKHAQLVEDSVPEEPFGVFVYEVAEPFGELYVEALYTKPVDAAELVRDLVHRMQHGFAPREILIDAAMIAIQYEARLRDGPLEPDVLKGLRADLAEKHRYRDALHQLNSDYRIDVDVPMRLMYLLHECTVVPRV
jgi:hypothetical protein